jgi:8-oxo-dGTP diphosphatase
MSGPADRANRVDAILASGGVLWRADSDGVSVALVHRPKYDDWSLPKGKLEPDEHPLVAARREILEETGFRAVLGRPLGVQRYPVRGRDKEVRYWSAEVVEGAFSPHAEIDDVVWLPPAQARSRVTRAADTTVLDAFAAGPVRTTPLILVRHADAVAREDWAGDDDERPLTPAGEAEARRLAALCSSYAVRRVLSSPALRCHATIGPYADAADVALKTDPALSERGFLRDPLASVSLVRECLRSDEGAVVCTHRPVLPPLLALVRATADCPVPDDPLGEGEVFVAHLAGERVVATERHTP